MVGGEDIRQKRKLLEKLTKGRKRHSQQSGNVTLSQAAFNSVLLIHSFYVQNAEAILSL
jgi:translation elongation factor EF-4